MKPNIFIVGPSGSGKSSSLRNCPPETTAILNSEQKALPFRGAGKFKMNVAISGLGSVVVKDKEHIVPSMDNYWKTFNGAINSDKVKLLINESFTSLSEQVYNCAKHKNPGDGFEVWADFKEEIGRILHRAKNTEKYVVFTGIDGVFEGANGIEERCIAVDGSWKKKVEKEFVIVLYTVAVSDGDKISYKFVTNKIPGFQNTPAKSPDGMLPPMMDNDIMEVIKYAEAYYNGEEIADVQEEKTEEVKEETQVDNQ